MKRVAIVDYGIGNTMSVMRAVEQVGGSPSLSSDPDAIRNADRVILPGVGAFEDGMDGLKRRGLDDAVIEFVATGRPLLGICLGMQMLMSKSKEHGQHVGLDLIPGKVVEIPCCEGEVRLRKIPHIGWSSLWLRDNNSTWNGTVLEDVPESAFVYFVHSFMAVPENIEHMAAHCIYEKLPVTAAVRKENVTGCQFHPEKSGPVGLLVVNRFMAL